MSFENVQPLTRLFIAFLYEIIKKLINSETIFSASQSQGPERFDVRDKWIIGHSFPWSFGEQIVIIKVIWKWVHFFYQKWPIYTSVVSCLKFELRTHRKSHSFHFELCGIYAITCLLLLVRNRYWNDN